MTGRLAIFDCDGTLVDGQAPICAAMDSAFAAAGLPAPDHRAVRRIVGLSLPQAIATLAPNVSPEMQDRITAAYRDAYRGARLADALEEPLFPGIATLIEQLAGDGWMLAVATGKSDVGLAHCLDTHGIRARFASLQTADRHPSKPHPAMIEAALAETGVDVADAVMIGDTSFDMAMADQCEACGRWGSRWGYHAPEELKRFRSRGGR